MMLSAHGWVSRPESSDGPGELAVMRLFSDAFAPVRVCHPESLELVQIVGWRARAPLTAWSPAQEGPSQDYSLKARETVSGSLEDLDLAALEEVAQPSEVVHPMLEYAHYSGKPRK